MRDGQRACYGMLLDGGTRRKKCLWAGPPLFLLRAFRFFSIATASASSDSASRAASLSVRPPPRTQLSDRFSFVYLFSMPKIGLCLRKYVQRTAAAAAAVTTSIDHYIANTAKISAIIIRIIMIKIVIGRSAAVSVMVNGRRPISGQRHCCLRLYPTRGVLRTLFKHWWIRFRELETGHPPLSGWPALTDINTSGVMLTLRSEYR